jgi:hypothetical protein
MRIDADDEVYRVNAVWLGPDQRFQFPWRATYRAYGVGLVLFMLGIGIAHQLYGVTFWSVVFTGLAAVRLTRSITRRMGYERPFSAVAAMAMKEMSAPRRSDRTIGLSAAARAVLATSHEPMPLAGSDEPAPAASTPAVSARRRRFRLPGRDERRST